MNRLQGKQYELRVRSSHPAVLSDALQGRQRKPAAPKTKGSATATKKCPRPESSPEKAVDSVRYPQKKSAQGQARVTFESPKKKKISKLKSQSYSSKKKENWTETEDKLLLSLVDKYGAKNWTEIATSFPNRLGKQCRERWYNHLSPEVNKAKWTEQEDQVLLNAYMEFGSRWSIIANYLPGRTDNSIKNHYNSTIKRKLKNNELNFTPTHIKLEVPSHSLFTAATEQSEQVRAGKKDDEQPAAVMASAKKETRSESIETSNRKEFGTPSVDYQMVPREGRIRGDQLTGAVKIRLPVINTEFLQSGAGANFLTDMFDEIPVGDLGTKDPARRGLLDTFESLDCLPSEGPGF